MKFRYKVLIINIIVLSIGIGTLGFFMIEKNFNLALDSQIKATIEENNIIQSVIEYETLGLSNISHMLPSAGDKVVSGMFANETYIYIIYDKQLIYTNSDTECPHSLWANAKIGHKNYIIRREGDRKCIYASSCNEVYGKKLNIVNKRDITPVYELMEVQKKYYQHLLFAVLFVCCLLIFFTSFMLTKPLEKLTKVTDNFTKSNYSARASINTRDEIGDLARTYNDMAASVSNHIDELQKMVSRQEQFVADFTHEIKTPMTSIIGYSDTIRSLNLPREEQVMAATYIFNEGKRLEAMSMKLFDFIYTKRHQIIPKEINSKGLMYRIEESVKPAYDSSGIFINAKSEEFTIMGDRDLLTSAFINLLDNARKASHKGSSVDFIGKVVQDSYEITVRDYGVGIDEQHIEKICDAFYMVDKSRSRKEGGAGLGLSLAVQIFKVHHADFHIESAPGKGCCITITFPQNLIIEKEKVYE